MSKVVGLLIGISVFVGILLVVPDAVPFAFYALSNSPGLSALSLTVQAFAIFFAALAWATIVESAKGKSLSVRNRRLVVGDHIVSWGARYIPGYVISIGAKVSRLKSWGIKIKDGTKLYLVDAFWLLSTGTAFGIITFASHSTAIGFPGNVVFFSAFAFFIFFISYRFLRLRAKSKRELVIRNINIAGSLGTSKTLALFFLSRIMTAFFYGITSVITGFPVESTMLVVAVSFLATTLGVLTPLVPSGLGIREASGVAALVFLGFPSVESISYFALTRALMVFADFFMLLTSLACVTLGEEKTDA